MDADNKITVLFQKRIDILLEIHRSRFDASNMEALDLAKKVYYLFKQYLAGEVTIEQMLKGNIL